ncbi:MAG: hypothetical protein HGA87_06200 [Desulfobulbaceae bacterium]|nr:hypothetical protein [Desulfobulbaceae bacterium]
MKFLDKTLGSALVQCFLKPASRSNGKPASFLIIRPGGIGDDRIKRRLSLAAVMIWRCATVL